MENNEKSPHTTQIDNKRELNKNNEKRTNEMEGVDIV